MTHRSISICAALGIVLLGVGCISEPPGSPDIGGGPDSGIDGGLADMSVVDAGTDATIPDDSGAMDAGDASDDMGVEQPPEFRRTSAGLLLYYRFQEGEEEIVDEGPGGRNVAIPDQAVLSPEGLDLPTSVFLQVPDSAGLANALRSAGAYTFETWITTEDDTYAPIFSFGAFTPAQVSADEQTTDAPICITGCATAANQVRNALARGRSTHLVVTAEETTVRVFVDGVLAGAWLVADPTSFANANAVLELGSFSIARTFGLLAVYDRALSPGEVLSHNLVGPRPEPTDVTNVELLALFSRVSDDGLFRAPASRRTIVEDELDGVTGSVVAAADQHGLYRQILALPSSGTHLYSELDFRSFRNQLASSGTLEVWQMRSDWNLDANWERSGVGDWGDSGATAPSDRGDAPIATFPVETNGRVFGKVWIDDLVEQALAQPSSNFGLQFTCSGCAVEVDNGRALVSDFNRLRIKSLFEQARSSANLVPPVVTSIELRADESYLVEWEQQADGVELFINGTLVRQVAFGNRLTFRLPGPIEETTVELRTVDRWGRVSATSPISGPD